MKARDAISLVVFGLVIGWAATIVHLHRNEIAKFIRRSVTIRRLTADTWPPFRLRLKDNPADGRKIWPVHAGGRTSDERYDWAYNELMKARGLKPEAAWKEFVLVFPDEAQPVELLELQKDKFKSAMNYRKRNKQREKTPK